MAFLNASVPLIKTMVRRQFLYNLEDKFGELDECMVFGVCSIRARAPLFHIMLPNGAIYYRVPIHAFYSGIEEEKNKMLSIEESCFWDCFSYYFSVHKYDFLKEMDCSVLLKNKGTENGRYYFTIDWCDPDGELNSSHSEIPDEHKCGHVIGLDSGNFVIYPNNRILWKESSFVVSNDEKIDYKTNTYNWYGEGLDFKTEDSDMFMYKTKKEEEL